MKACFKSILDCKHPLERNMMNNQKRAKILPIFIFTILTILAPALAFVAAAVFRAFMTTLGFCIYFTQLQGSLLSSGFAGDVRLAVVLVHKKLNFDATRQRKMQRGWLC
jgi:hypothetical protein